MLRERGVECQRLLFFESHRWRLYETGQASRSEEEAVKGLRKPRRKVPGVVSPGKPDSDGVVARGAGNLRGGEAIVDVTRDFGRVATGSECRSKAVPLVAYGGESRKLGVWSLGRSRRPGPA